MPKKLKIGVYLIGAAAGISIVVFLIGYLGSNKYRDKIPVLDNTGSIAIPVKEQIEGAVKTAKRKPTAENLGQLGKVYHASAQYQEAAESYELAIERNDDNWIWNYYNGYLAIEMGKPQVAIEQFKTVARLNPKAGLAWYYLGQQYKNLRENEEAIQALNKVISNPENSSITKSSTRNNHFPLQTYALFEMARVYYDEGEMNLAKETLHRLIQKDNLFGPAFRLLGNIYSIQGDEINGEKYTTRASDLLLFSPPVDSLIDRLALMSRSELYLLKKIDEAEKSFHADWAARLVEHSMKYLPENGYLYSKAIRIFLWKGQVEEANLLVEKHMQLFEDNFAELKNTGMIYYQKDRYPQAIRYWKKSLELRPNDMLVKKYLARCYYENGNHDAAIQIILDQAEQQKNDAVELADLTYILFEFGAQEKALQNLERLKKLDPSNPTVKKISGQIAQINGELSNAISFYESALKQNPEDLETIRNLGDLLFQQELWKKYIVNYEEALEHHPNNPEFLAKLGEALITCPDESLRNIESGREFSERAFTFYNCPPDILISAGSQLSYAYAMLGEKQKALGTIGRTVNIGRQLKIEPERQQKLENLYRGIQSMQ